MKEELKEIKSGIGLGNLKFGMTRDQVHALLGEPDEREVTEDIDDEGDLNEQEGQSEAWHYDSLDLSMSFDEEDDWRLVILAVSSANYLLHGRSLIGLSMEELVDVLQDMDINDLEQGEWQIDDEHSQELISSLSMSMNFWIDEGELSDIQWGPHFSDEDTIQWPE